MKTKRTLPTYYVNPKRNKQYDDALHEYLRSTWKLPGRTYTQIARALGLGDPSKDEAYGKAIMYALHDFAENDMETICWHPNLRLKEADLQKKREKSKYNDYHLKLYKFAPQRKEMNRDPSKADEVVNKLILSLIEVKGKQSGNAIATALKMKLGYVSQAVVDRCLSALIKNGDVVADVRSKTLTLHSLP